MHASRKISLIVKLLDIESLFYIKMFFFKILLICFAYIEKKIIEYDCTRKSLFRLLSTENFIRKNCFNFRYKPKILFHATVSRFPLLKRNLSHLNRLSADHRTFLIIFQTFARGYLFK